jgi:DNA repair protein RecO (recombination protein O)
MTRPEALPAYVLHSRAYRESGAIVDFLTRDFGRVSLFATGVGPSTSGKRRSNGIAALLQPFTAVLLTWRGANDGGQLSAIEAAGPPWCMPPARVMSAFYLNELLIKLLPRDDAHPGLFDAYHFALAALAGAAGSDPAAKQAEARALRKFEYALLEELGLCADFANEAGTGEPVEPGGTYRLRASLGLVRVGGTMPGFPGAHLLSLVAGELEDDAVLTTARLVLRELLDAALEGRPLLTRRVARGVASLMAANTNTSANTNLPTHTASATNAVTTSSDVGAGTADGDTPPG